MSQQINLFNPAFEPQRRLFTANKMGAALAVVALGLSVAAAVTHARVAALRADAGAGAGRVEQAQARLTRATTEFVPRKATPALQAQLAEAEQRLTALQKVQGTIAGGALGNPHGYAETFRALARQGVGGLWLTAVTVGGSGADGGDIAVRGRALDAALVPGYIGRLRNEAVLQGKPIGSLTIDQGVQKETAAADGKAAAPLPPFVEFRFQSALAPEAKP
jgi:hypothetical protein